MGLGEDIQTLVKSAYAALQEFLSGLVEIQKERQEIIAAAHQREDQKKLEIIKSKITQL